MKTTHLLPQLLATILIVGPVLAQNGAPKQREIELAVEAGARAAEEAVALARREVENAQRDIERNLASAERQMRLAQVQGGQAVAAAGPALRRAFGATFVNTPEPPLIVATSKLDATALSELREDLSVMGKLVSDAVADEREDGDGHAMGIVVKWLPGMSANNNLYLEGTGAIIQAAVRFPLKPAEKEAVQSAPEPSRNSAWESARRELYGGKPDESEITVPADKREEYSADRVESLQKAVLKTLANANNFRRLGEQETVTVVVRNRTGNRAQFVFWQASETHGRGNRSHDADDSTMTIRVKKSDADALAAGKITEKEFQKRAQVAVY